VLGLMVRHGYISQQEANLAASEEIGFASVPFPIEAPHFVMYVRGQLEKEFGLEAIYTQGLQVYTTLHLDAQNAVLRSLRYRLAQLADTREGQPPRNVRNAARCWRLSAAPTTSTRALTARSTALLPRASLAPPSSPSPTRLPLIPNTKHEAR